MLRELARQGVLAATAATASPAERRKLTAPAYTIAAPLVYDRATRHFEYQDRGHPECARSMRHLRDDCLDRFHDDVESVVDYLLAYAIEPIDCLEAWLTSRLNAAMVDGYRKRRGTRGALQRPRPSVILDRELGHDPWLTRLAIKVLEWVGSTATAGSGLWPLDSWAEDRAKVTGDWAGSTPATVRADVEVVLTALRRRPDWYHNHVETPLGRKQAPVAPAPRAGTEHLPVSLSDPDALEEAHLYGLASTAIGRLRRRLAAGEDPQAVVVEVLGETFGAGTGQYELDRPPHATVPHEERVRQLLASPSDLRRIVDAVLSIVLDS